MRVFVQSCHCSEAVIMKRMKSGVASKNRPIDDIFFLGFLLKASSVF